MFAMSKTNVWDRWTEHKDLVALVAKGFLSESPPDSVELKVLAEQVERLDKLGILSNVANLPTCGNPSADKALWFDFTHDNVRFCGWLFFDRGLKFIEFHVIPSR